ncbi:MAG TPA: efflux transporter outer membrane subunit [Candidatus Hydrogenedentes bacterium]|nr:efflux transporter outer membrane subunit [Candidatus Hydrogenedentota bacterium]
MRTIALLLALLVSGCTMAPHYKRPENAIPNTYRDVTSADASTATQAGESFGDLGWWGLFNDEELQKLIHQGIENNYDIRIAAQRVIQAHAQITIAQAGLFPSLTANAQERKTEVFQIGSTPLEPKPGLLNAARDPSAGSESFTTGLNLAWELDFWGRVLSARKAARAQLLETEAGRQAVIQSVVTGIAQAYLGLIESDLELSIAQNTLESRKKSLRLVQARKEHGVASKLDVDQSEALVTSAAVKIPMLEGKIAQYENQISILIGSAPTSIPRGKSLEQQQISFDVPAGLPSELLERRPDIRAAEQSLIAANANIGEARAAFFPKISLTAALGTVSPAMAGVFNGPAGTASIAPSAAWPLFNAGKLLAGLRTAKARREECLLTYQKTILQALREVSDALIAHRKAHEVRKQMESLMETWRDASRLAQLRYKGGVTSYLEVLDSERQLFEAELNLAQSKCDELLTVVTLYKALGGGWKLQEANKSVE